MGYGEFSELEDLILNYLIDRWQLGDRSIDSEKAYTDLVGAGVTICNGAMYKILRRLQNEQTIQAVQLANPETKRIHGDMRITWVDTTAM